MKQTTNTNRKRSVDSTNEATLAERFGGVFVLNHQPADVTPCRGAIRSALAQLGDLYHRPIIGSEQEGVFGAVRREALNFGRWRVANESTHDYPIGLPPLSDGTVIRMRITTVRRRSVQGSAVRVMQVELVDSHGEPIGTMLALPFLIDNGGELAQAYRMVYGGHYRYETLGRELFQSWRRMGAPTMLPVEFPLGQTLEGRTASLRLDSTGGGSEDGRAMAHAVFVLDGAEVIEPRDCRARLYAVVCREAIDFRALAALGGKDADDLRICIEQRFDAFTVLDDKLPEPAISSVWDGEALVFPTGEQSPNGREMYALATARGDDGRFTECLWVEADELAAAGVAEPPVFPDFTELTNFGRGHLEGVVSSHLLRRAGRWATSATVGFTDEFGRDHAADPDAAAQQTQELQAMLTRGIAVARSHGSAWGYSNGDVRDVGLRKAHAWPISCFLPDVGPEGKVRGVVAVRRRWERGDSVLEAVTYLDLAIARRNGEILRIVQPRWFTDGIVGGGIE